MSVILPSLISAWFSVMIKEHVTVILIIFIGLHRDIQGKFITRCWENCSLHLTIQFVCNDVWEDKIVEWIKISTVTEVIMCMVYMSTWHLWRKEDNNNEFVGTSISTMAWHILQNCKSKLFLILYGSFKSIPLFLISLFLYKNLSG
jgi:hypothetical protein